MPAPERSHHVSEPPPTLDQVGDRAGAAPDIQARPAAEPDPHSGAEPNPKATPPAGHLAAEPGPDGNTAADWEFLNCWTIQMSVDAGVSGPCFMAEALQTLCDESADNHERRAALNQASGFAAGAQHRDQTRQLEAVIERLGRVWTRPSARPTKVVSSTPPPSTRALVAPVARPPAAPSVTPKVATAQPAREIGPVPISEIVMDAGTQVRAGLNADAVQGYADAMHRGDQFPPVVLFDDGARKILGDGFHRVAAAKANGVTKILAEVRTGDVTAALWYALGSNRTNGVHLSSTDKRNAISKALQGLADRSNRAIADQVGCSESYVRKIADELRTGTQLTRPDRTVGLDGKRRKAARKPTMRVRPPPSVALASPVVVTAPLEDASVAPAETFEPQPQQPPPAPPLVAGDGQVHGNPEQQGEAHVQAAADVAVGGNPKPRDGQEKLAAPPRRAAPQPDGEDVLRYLEYFSGYIRGRVPSQRPAVIEAMRRAADEAASRLRIHEGSQTVGEIGEAGA
jgi:hypothetical protein